MRCGLDFRETHHCYVVGKLFLRYAGHPRLINDDKDRPKSPISVTGINTVVPNPYGPRLLDELIDLELCRAAKPSTAAVSRASAEALGAILKSQ